jgi:L-lactate dehydrogenase
MKVSIIGGGGRVGACAAFALQMRGFVDEIMLLDANQAAAEGEALDLLHGAAYTSDQTIRAVGYSEAAAANVICITAGSRRKPDESRLDLVNRNTSIFIEIMNNLKSAGIKPCAKIFVVSNPVDILTDIAVEISGLPENQVLGLGTVLDTSRFCSLISEQLKLPPTQVRAMILGEHGDSMLPLWSSATLDGFPLTKFPGVTANFQTQIFDRTKKSGAEVISRKGGAGWAVAVGIAEVIESIVLDRGRILPVSSRIRGAYGIRNISLSVPTRVTRDGAVEHIELELWPKELNALQTSARELMKTRQQVRQTTSV